MRFLTVSTMAFIASVLVVWAIRTWLTAKHSQPGSCGCREGRGWPNRQIACSQCSFDQRCAMWVKIALVVFAFYLPAWNQLQGKAGP